MNRFHKVDHITTGNCREQPLEKPDGWIVCAAYG